MNNQWYEHCDHEAGAEYDYPAELWAGERAMMEQEAFNAECEAVEAELAYNATCPAHVEAWEDWQAKLEETEYEAFKLNRRS